MNYGQVKILAQAYINRKDINFDDLQPLAVDDINSLLTVRENEAVQSVVLAAAGIQNLFSGPLPIDFARPRAVFAGMAEIKPIDIQGLLGSGHAQKSHYAITGAQIYTAAASPLTVVYSLRMPLLVADGDTNAVLANMSPVYLYALLKHAAHRIQDFDALAQHQAEFDRQVGELNAQYAMTTLSSGAAARTLYAATGG